MPTGKREVAGDSDVGVRRTGWLPSQPITRLCEKFPVIPCSKPAYREIRTISLTDNVDNYAENAGICAGFVDFGYEIGGNHASKKQGIPRAANREACAREQGMDQPVTGIAAMSEFNVKLDDLIHGSIRTTDINRHHPWRVHQHATRILRRGVRFARRCA